MTINKHILLFLVVLANAAQAELETVASVDIAKYLGKWHEIARFENKHQKGCVETQAEYTQKANFIEVRNHCILEDGKEKEVRGRAKVDDTVTNAKLKVNFTPALIRFFGIGWGNYWIIERGQAYEYAVVSEPKMEYLWILSREKPMKKELYEAILGRLKQKGFNTENLVVAKNALMME